MDSGRHVQGLPGPDVYLSRFFGRSAFHLRFRGDVQRLERERRNRVPVDGDPLGNWPSITLNSGMPDLELSPSLEPDRL
jgi:hypothetical protein